MSSNSICSICKQKNLSIDFSKIKSMKIKNFINKNRIRKEDLLTKFKKCKCKKTVHKFCILLNILFNYELKCPDCNTFYDIKIIKQKNTKEKYKLILLTILLLLIHIILYGCCVILVLFDLTKFEMNDFNHYINKRYMFAQYFFALILLIINSYLFYKTMKGMLIRFKHCYIYFIDIQEKTNNDMNDSKYFKPLYEFYRTFNNDKIRYLVCKRNENFFYNKITYNNDYKNFIKKNSSEFQLSNGNPSYNNEEILKLNNKNNNSKIIDSQNNNNEDDKNVNNRINPKKNNITFGNDRKEE